MRTSLPPSHRTPTRPVSDRWAFKPVALLLLVPVIVATAGLVAVAIAPPFVGISLGVKQLDKRLQAAGANFTRIPDAAVHDHANDGRPSSPTSIWPIARSCRCMRSRRSRERRSSRARIPASTTTGHSTCRRCCAPWQPTSAPRRSSGRLHDRPATGEAHAGDPTNRSIGRKFRGRARDAGRAEVFEEPDPRDVPE